MSFSIHSKNVFSSCQVRIWAEEQFTTKKRGMVPASDQLHVSYCARSYPAANLLGGARYRDLASIYCSIEMCTHKATAEQLTHGKALSHFYLAVSYLYVHTLRKAIPHNSECISNN